METPAFVLCWSSSDPSRVGEIARLLPGDHRIGDVSRTDVPPLYFAPERPGTAHDGSPLRHGLGRVAIHAGIFGARLRMIERTVYVNGRPLPIGQWHDLAPGDTVSLRDELLLLFTVCRPPQPLVHFPHRALSAFGEPDTLGIVGESEAVWRWREEIAAAAGSNENVLIHGGVGTGKEPTARGIHALSSRANEVYCGDVLAGNWDYPVCIYGHAENARGIPEPAHEGVLDAIHGGTLNVDHVQLHVSKVGVEALDRVLERGGEYFRMGYSSPRISRFVLLVTTNEDSDAVHPLLLRHVQRRLRTPTLAEHPEDIPLLIDTLIRRDLEKAPVWKELGWVDATGRPSPPLRAVERLVRADYAEGGAFDLHRRLIEEGDRAYEGPRGRQGTAR